MDLKETIRMMLSADYKERFIAEYTQLTVRMEGLSSVIDGYINGTLDFTPSCSLTLLKLQYHAMRTYRDVLKSRAKIQNIRLPMFPMDCECYKEDIVASDEEKFV